MLNFILYIFYSVFIQIHPFHVSVCDVEFNKKTQSVQISQRIFLNDLETALNKKFGKNLMIDDKSKLKLRDSLISVYLKEKLVIRVDGKAEQATYLGSEFEEDGIWCYIEYKNIKRAKEIEVQSTVLLESFDDQANIIHFKVDSFEKSVKLDQKTIASLFVLPKN